MIKKTPRFIVFFLISLILLLAVFISGIKLVSCFFVAGKTSSGSHQILRMIFYGSSENPEGETVSASIALLDRKGGEIVRIERSWPEPFLAVDFAGANLNGCKFYFPEKIYGTNSVVEKKTFFRWKYGTNLVPYYMENGTCLFGTYREERNNLFKIASFVLNPVSLIFSGIYIHHTINLSSCKSGIYYGIFLENGELLLRNE